VRQYRAHAWVEVWLDDMGWTRVDPVAFIDPSRIDPSIANLGAGAGTADGRGAGRRAGWHYRMAVAWDTANTLWFRHVVGYGPATQSRLLEWMGSRGDQVRDLFMLLTLVLGLLALGLLLLSWVTARDRVDPLVRGWQRVTRRLARRGFRQEPGETAIAYAQRIAALDPDLGGRLLGLAMEYQRLRYGHEHQTIERLQFMRDARTFRG